MYKRSNKKLHIQTYCVALEANYTEHYKAFYMNVFMFIHLAATSVWYFIKTLKLSLSFGHFFYTKLKPLKIFIYISKYVFANKKNFPQKKMFSF